MVLQDEILTYTPEQLKEYAAAMIFQLLSMLASFVGIFIFLYIINGIALTAISKKLKFQSSYIAWIPLAAPYVEGKIGDYMRSNKLDKTHTRIHYLMFNFMYWFFCY